MNPGGQGGNQTDQTANFFWILAIVVGVILLVWWLARQWFVTPIFWLRVHEIDFIYWFAAAWDNLISYVNVSFLAPIDLSMLDHARHYMQITNPKHIDVATFTALNNYVGDFVRYPVSVILGILAFIVYFRHNTIRFRHSFNMKTLREKEQENWPQITPVISLDLVKQDPDEGEWAMAKLPLDFGKENNVVSLVEKNKRTVWTIDRGAAHRLFVMQLGPRMGDLNKLPIHVKALFVVFVARATRERAIASKLLSQIAASASSGKLDFTGVEEQFQRLKDTHIIKWLLNRHAYITTFMASLLEIARADGVIATAEFLWLKPVDRRMWFVLNTVGRQTSVVEVAGPFSHWLAEKELKRAVKTPMVDEAVNALQESLEDTLYVDAGEKWHTSNVA